MACMDITCIEYNYVPKKPADIIKLFLDLSVFCFSVLSDLLNYKVWFDL